MATAPRGLSEKIIVVEITATGAIPDSVIISKSRKQEVEWRSKKAHIVRFPAAKCPFTESEFLVPANSGIRSGPAKEQAETCDTCSHHPAPSHVKGHHAYNIHESKGPVVVDPQIIILD